MQPSTVTPSSSPAKKAKDTGNYVPKHDLPLFDLVLTSPPYASFDSTQNDPIEKYLADFDRIFSMIIDQMTDSGTLVLEISNVKDNRGNLPLAWHCGLLLAEKLEFMGEHIRCNTSDVPAGPGYDHSYLMIFNNAIST